MASTIITKNGTGSASPSSLQQGELAINVDSGKIFYGAKGGTAVSSSFTFDELVVEGNLTAQQYIVSSSVTYVTQSFSSGSTIFGDSLDDTHQFTGSVEITGSLTATNLSGTNTGDQDLSSYIQNSQTSSMSVATASYVAAANIDGTIDISDQTNLAGGTNITLSDDTLNLDADISLTSVTASGAISASGALIGNTLTAAGLDYPTADGEDGYVIKTDGAGNLSFDRPTIYAKVKNISGGTLAKGTPVHATGSSGNASEVVAASASVALTMPATFVLAEELADEAEGNAIVTGFIQGVDTSQFGEGDVVYVGADGGYTNVKPTGSNLIQNLGIVTKVHGSNGSGFIYGSGRSNDVPNISPGYAWVGNSDSVATAVATSSFSVATASYVAADNIAQPFSTFEVNGPSNSHVEVGTYIVGYDSAFGPLVEGLQITGSGLIISGAMAASHHNMLKIGEVELIDLNTNYLGIAGNPGEFLIHNVKSFKITSGSDNSDIAEANVAFQHDGDSFYLCKGGELVANATIKSVSSTTTIQDNDILINAANGPSLRALNSTTSTHIAGFAADPNTSPRVMQSIDATNFFQSVGGAVTASAVSASGEVRANALNIDGTQFLDLHSTGFRIGASSEDAIIFGSSLRITPPITASGAISSSGDLIVNEINPTKIELEKSSTTDGDANGEIVYFGSTTSMDTGKIYYYNSSGNWTLTDADAESSADGLLAVALGASSDTDGMLIKGMVTLDHDPGTVGDPLYLSTTAGQATSTAPSATNDIVRLIGYCLDSTNGQIYFNPSNDFIKHA